MGKRLFLAAALLGASVLGGCVAYPYDPAYGGQPAYAFTPAYAGYGPTVFGGPVDFSPGGDQHRDFNRPKRRR
jgi:hypothetical protein